MCRCDLVLSGVHRSCTRDDIVKLKVMHAERSLFKTREFSAKVNKSLCHDSKERGILLCYVEGKEDRNRHICIGS